jgi:integrating conjugative element protein (TIGR03749 family)
MFKKLSFYLMLVASCSVNALTNALHLVWEKTPLHISLPIGKERTIVFPSNITILHNELKQGGLAVISKASNTLYVKSLTEFNEKTVFVEIDENGEKIKINFSSTDANSSTRPIEVEVNGLQSQNQESQENSKINPISLTRFAIQSLYTPERVVEKVDGIGRVAMQTSKTVNIIYGGAVISHPLISFGGNGLVVTAVEIKNNISQSVKLTPQMVIGKWESASFYPSNRLSPRGSYGDKTTLFVTSDRSFGEALYAYNGELR